FRNQLRISRTDVMHRHRIRHAIVAKVTAGDGNRQYKSILSPFSIEFHQDTQHLLEILSIIFRGHEIGPRLVVVAGGGPASRFEKAGKYRKLYEPVRESARAPTIANQFMNRMIGFDRFLHINNLFSNDR